MKLAVIIGRFQPCHKSHLELFKVASEYDEVIVLLGSANKRDKKNPFSPLARETMILSSLEEQNIPSLHFTFYPISDYEKDEDWQKEVTRLTWILSDNRFDQITLVGAEKDNSSYYLKLFPEWKLHLVPIKPLDATTVHNLMLENTDKAWAQVRELVTLSVYKNLLFWRQSPAGQAWAEQ